MSVESVRLALALAAVQFWPAPADDGALQRVLGALGALEAFVQGGKTAPVDAPPAIAPAIAPIIETEEPAAVAAQDAPPGGVGEAESTRLADKAYDLLKTCVERRQACPTTLTLSTCLGVSQRAVVDILEQLIGEKRIEVKQHGKRRAVKVMGAWSLFNGSGAQPDEPLNSEDESPAEPPPESPPVESLPAEPPSIRRFAPPTPVEPAAPQLKANKEFLTQADAVDAAAAWLRTRDFVVSRTAEGSYVLDGKRVAPIDVLGCANRHRRQMKLAMYVVKGGQAA